MDEYQLIEIATRFRALEDAVEEAQTHLRLRGESFGKEHPIGESALEIRDRLEELLEQCREDMTAMQEIIRARSAKAS